MAGTLKGRLTGGAGARPRARGHLPDLGVCAACEAATLQAAIQPGRRAAGQSGGGGIGSSGSGLATTVAGGRTRAK
jgi:hypothetical protein